MKIDNNELLMIVMAFVIGYILPGMMKQMCGRRLVEGSSWTDFKSGFARQWRKNPLVEIIQDAHHCPIGSRCGGPTDESEIQKLYD
jgi:hypothetical protein